MEVFGEGQRPVHVVVEERDVTVGGTLNRKVGKGGRVETATSKVIRVMPFQRAVSELRDDRLDLFVRVLLDREFRGFGDDFRGLRDRFAEDVAEKGEVASTLTGCVIVEAGFPNP